MNLGRGDPLYTFRGLSGPPFCSAALCILSLIGQSGHPAANSRAPLPLLHWRMQLTQSIWTVRDSTFSFILGQGDRRLTPRDPLCPRTLLFFQL